MENKSKPLIYKILVAAVSIFHIKVPFFIIIIAVVLHNHLYYIMTCKVMIILATQKFHPQKQQAQFQTFTENTNFH